MSNISCSRCLKKFKYNYLLERHKNKKVMCKEIVPDKIEEVAKKLEETTKKLDSLTSKFIEREENNKFTGYKCKYCGKVYTRKDNLLRHENKGRCKLKNDNITIYERELGILKSNRDLECRFCKKQYTTKSNFCRHQNKGCKEKRYYEKELEERVLTERNKAAEPQTINNNYANTNTININLPPMRAFGDENLDYITTNYLLQELNKCSNMNDMTTVVSSFTSMIHANPAHPENHNVQIRSLNGGYARVFNGKAFEDRQALDIQDQILQRVGTLITDKCDEFQEQTDYAQTHKINDRSIERVRSTISDDVIDQIEYVGSGGLTNRTLTNYRTKVKSTLHSNKGNIQSTQKLLLDSGEIIIV